MGAKATGEGDPCAGGEGVRVIYVMDGGFGWTCWKWILDEGDRVTMSRSYPTRERAEGGLMAYLDEVDA